MGVPLRNLDRAEFCLGVKDHIARDKLIESRAAGNVQLSSTLAICGQQQDKRAKS